MQRILLLILIGLPPFAACTPFPDLNVPLDSVPSAEFPVLVPIDPLLLTAADNTADAEEKLQILTARLSQLRLRSSAMQVTVIDQRTKRQMNAAIRRHVQ